MGAPRASAFLDQMRNVQSSARRGGEFANGAAAWNRNCSAPTSQLDRGTAAAKQVALTCWPESAFASGCDGDAVFFGDVAQQVLLAQQLGWQAFSLGALERMHDRAARPTGAVKSAAAIAIEIMILLNIDLRIAQVRPRVEGKRSAACFFYSCSCSRSGSMIRITSTRCFRSLFATGLRPIAKPFKVASDMLIVIMENSENHL